MSYIDHEWQQKVTKQIASLSEATGIRMRDLFGDICTELQSRTQVMSTYADEVKMGSIFSAQELFDWMSGNLGYKMMFDKIVDEFLYVFRVRDNVPYFDDWLDLYGFELLDE